MKKPSPAEQVFALHGDYFNREKVVPIRADLADPDLVDRLTANDTMRDINVVIHCAAKTSFLQQKTAAIMETNIGGTQRIIQWALGLHDLKTFAYVGTATIAALVLQWLARPFMRMTRQTSEPSISLDIRDRRCSPKWRSLRQSGR